VVETEAFELLVKESIMIGLEGCIIQELLAEPLILFAMHTRYTPQATKSKRGNQTHTTHNPNPNHVPTKTRHYAQRIQKIKA